MYQDRLLWSTAVHRGRSLIAFGRFVLRARADNQALIDGPTTSVPRQAIAYRHLILTPYTITTLPRAAGSGAIKKAFEKAQVVEKWEASSWAKKLAARQSRKVSKLRVVQPLSTLSMYKWNVENGWACTNSWTELTCSKPPTLTDSRSSSPSDRDEIRSAELTPRRRRLPSKFVFASANSNLSGLVWSRSGWEGEE